MALTILWHIIINLRNSTHKHTHLTCNLKFGCTLPWSLCYCKQLRLIQSADTSALLEETRLTLYETYYWQTAFTVRIRSRNNRPAEPELLRCTRVNFPPNVSHYNVEVLIDIILPAALRHGTVDSASNRNENQKFFLGGGGLRRPVRRAELTIFKCLLS